VSKDGSRQRAGTPIYPLVQVKQTTIEVSGLFSLSFIQSPSDEHVTPRLCHFDIRNVYQKRVWRSYRELHNQTGTACQDMKRATAPGLVNIFLGEMSLQEKPIVMVTGNGNRLQTPKAPVWMRGL
jgi:hypothetical protein